MVKQTNLLNPFKLPTAQAAWTARHPLPTRLRSAAKGAIWDLFVQNPRDMTVGTLATANEYNLKGKIGIGCLAAFGACYTLMLYGATTFGAGYAVQALGVGSGLSVIASTGLKVKRIGEITFLSGSVPVYAVIYVLPKKIIQSLPAVCEYLASKVERLAQAIFNHILLPIWNVSRPILNWTWKVLSSAIDKAVLAIQFIYRNTIARVWQSVVRPILRWSFKVLAAAFDKTIELIALTFQHIIIPTWQHVLRPLLSWSWKLLSVVIGKTAQTVQWIYQSAIEPLCKRILFPVLRIIVDKVSAVASKLFPILRNILGPVVRGIYNALEVTARVISNQIEALQQVCSRVSASVAAIYPS